MSEKQPYSYTILRYVHDVMTGEFVNVGVIMHVPSQRRVITKIRNTIGRVTSVFPDLDRDEFTSEMNAVQREFANVAKERVRDNFIFADMDATAYARLAIPPDDSSLQWSSLGSGLTNNIDQTFERLYERFVSRYDTNARHCRSDDDVWSPVLQMLEERKIASHLQEKTISGPVDNVQFKHAWKNRSWHVYVPISFDLSDADDIKTKAREWLGHLTAVVAGDHAETFKPHFIVGAPRDPMLRNAYESAVAILRRAPNEPEIFDETQIDELIARIEDEVRAHNGQAA